MIKDELTARGLPNVLISKDGDSILDIAAWEANREKVKELLCINEYGLLPERPSNITFDILETNDRYLASKAIYQKIMITVNVENGVFSFPVYFIQPKTPQKHKTIVHINFRDNLPDRYLPIEEICDNGFAVALFCYKDVTSEDDDFSNGLSGVLFNNKKRRPSDPGKIMIWAWAAMRVMDFLQTQATVDLNNIAVLGHSRLGKTALVTAAFDERFAFVHSNDSGCSGSAISRGKDGETIDDACRIFPYWFCENYNKYRNNEKIMPFDQHYLLSLIAPRKLSVGSAIEDSWADPISEFLSCVAASPVYSLYGETGLIAPDRYPIDTDVFHKGSIGYYLRKGSHYLSRFDWNRFMEFFNSNAN